MPAARAKPISISAYETARLALEPTFMIHVQVLYIDEHMEQRRKQSFV